MASSWHMDVMVCIRNVAVLENVQKLKSLIRTNIILQTSFSHLMFLIFLQKLKLLLCG